MLLQGKKVWLMFSSQSMHNEYYWRLSNEMSPGPMYRFQGGFHSLKGRREMIIFGNCVTYVWVSPLFSSHSLLLSPEVWIQIKLETSLVIFFLNDSWVWRIWEFVWIWLLCKIKRKSIRIKSPHFVCHGISSFQFLFYEKLNRNYFFWGWTDIESSISLASPTSKLDSVTFPAILQISMQ